MQQTGDSAGQGGAAGGRLGIESPPEALIVTNPARRQRLLIFFILVSVAAFLFLSVNASFDFIAAFSKTGMPSGGIMARLEDCVTVVGRLLIDLFVVLMMGYYLLWYVGGREVIFLSRERLQIEHHVPGWSRVRVFEPSLVLHMRVRGRPDPIGAVDAFFGFTPRGYGAIEFDYGGRKVRLGIGMDAAEADEVLRAVEKRFPELVRPGTEPKSAAQGGDSRESAAHGKGEEGQ